MGEEAINTCACSTDRLDWFVERGATIQYIGLLETYVLFDGIPLTGVNEKRGARSKFDTANDSILVSSVGSLLPRSGVDLSAIKT